MKTQIKTIQMSKMVDMITVTVLQITPIFWGIYLLAKKMNLDIFGWNLTFVHFKGSELTGKDEQWLFQVTGLN